MARPGTMVGVIGVLLALFASSGECGQEIRIDRGRVSVVLPAGWRQSEKNGITTLEPGDDESGLWQVHFLPVEAAVDGFKKWSTEAWWRFKQDNGFVDELPQEYNAPDVHGMEGFLAYGELPDRKLHGKQVQYVALGQGGCALAFFNVVTTMDGAEAFFAGFKEIMASVRFTRDCARSARDTVTGRDGEPEGPAGANALLGKWELLEVRTGSKMAFSYEFRPDGTFAHTNFMDSQMGSCATTVFNTMNGRWSTSDDRLILDEAHSHQKLDSTCGSSYDKDVPAKSHSYPFRIKREEGVLKLVLLDAESGELVYRRK